MKLNKNEKDKLLEKLWQKYHLNGCGPHNKPEIVTVTSLKTLVQPYEDHPCHNYG